MPIEDRQNIVVQKLSDLNAAVTRAKTERIQKEASYNQIRNCRTTALRSIPSPRSSPIRSFSCRRASSRRCSGSRRSFRQIRSRGIPRW